MVKFTIKPVKGDVEDPEEYRIGGFHPVHLGDMLKGNRYTIKRKLGYGAFSTIWLAWDILIHGEVALKIAKADAEHNELKALLHMKDYALQHEGKNNVLALLDHFDINGPNGTHQCLVLEVMDGSLNHRRSYPSIIVKEMSRQIARGLDFVHKCGLVHGDLYPANILFRNTHRKRRSCHKEQRKLNLERKYGLKDAHYPRYLVDHTSYDSNSSDDSDEWEATCISEVGIEIKISDFGVSHIANDRPQRSYTPLSFRAPEQITPSAIIDQKSDIWSFACNIYQWITRTPLIPVFVLGSINDADYKDVLLIMTDRFGDMPDYMLSKWPGSADPKNDDRLYQQLTLAQSLTHQLHFDIKTQAVIMKERQLHMNAEEIFNLNDMLCKMLKYERTQRSLASELLDHPWLR